MGQPRVFIKSRASGLGGDIPRGLVIGKSAVINNRSNEIYMTLISALCSYEHAYRQVTSLNMLKVKYYFEWVDLFLIFSLVANYPSGFYRCC